jgi:choline dehydrogenase-like flavoprotein
MNDVVIGSGPAGVAAARALCDAGRRVTVVDAGGRIEAGKMDVFDALGRTEPGEWPAELAARARESFPVGLKHVPLKPSYGSLFPYALDDPDLPVKSENAETLPSLACGGLSNSWGASVLPYRAEDIEDWPVSIEELAPHYEAVQRFMPVAAEADELSGRIPLYADSPGVLKRGPQAEMVLARLRRRAPALRDAGFTFGASRLAVATAGDDPSRCRHGGLCLHGCPYGSIYNANRTLDELVRAGKVEYRGGLYVDRLSETAEAVKIDFHRRAGAGGHGGRGETADPRDAGGRGERGEMSAARVFVACGAISSTRLVFESLGRPRFDRSLKDSQYFVVPVLTARAAPVSVKTQGNTLAQVFIELEDEEISKYTVHLQLYGYNDILLAALAGKLPLKPSAVERLFRPLLGRLVVIQGYLHSADSPGLTLSGDGRGVRLIGDDTAEAAARVKRVVWRLAASARLLGMAPLPGLTQTGRPGKGNHLGGAFPMRSNPGELETDTLGRLPGTQRIHIVDAAVFPSFPATTVTISVMANAHRIAAGAARQAALM